MRIAKLLGLVLATVSVISTMALSSALASPLFLSHPLGLLLASAEDQQFTNTAGTVECQSLKLLPPGDSTVALRSLSILVVVDYEVCNFFFLPLAIHPVRYRIDANGLVALENDVLMLAEEGCKITWPAAKNRSLGTVKFDNNSVNNGLLLLVSLKKITSFGEGGPLSICQYPEEGAGGYTGTIHLKLDSTAGIPNTLRWDP